MAGKIFSTNSHGDAPGGNGSQTQGGHASPPPLRDRVVAAVVISLIVAAIGAAPYLWNLVGQMASDKETTSSPSNRPAQKESPGDDAPQPIPLPAREVRQQPDRALSVEPGSGNSFRDCPTCPEMVVVPSGGFMMGSPPNEPERASGERQLKVTISKPFAVGKYEVTRDQYKAFVDDTGHISSGFCSPPRNSDLKRNGVHVWKSPGFAQDDWHPVVCVGWSDARSYARWLSRKTGKAYRVLSEAEWEYAARAGTTTKFWWGHSIYPNQANYRGNFIYDGGNPDGDCRGKCRIGTVPVDSFKANPWGLYQVHGNVWEWTSDCWNASNSGNPGDGSARSTGNCGAPVARGGSWNSNPGELRSAYRDGDFTAVGRGSRGIRIGRTTN